MFDNLDDILIHYEEIMAELASPDTANDQDRFRKLMKELGYSEGYKYAHQFEGNFVDQEFLPEGLEGTKFYEPGKNAREEELRRRLESLWKKYNY